MKQVIALVFFLWTQDTLAVSHHVPWEPDDQGVHLPSVGSSLFDKIYSEPTESGATVYNVPYPLNRLVSRVSEFERDFVYALFPFSRSLQRPMDLSYDPLLNPRIVLTPARDVNSLARGKLFFGFVKAKDQLEVISYNDEAGRFEYQIVTDYSSNPKVFYVDRGKCLSCHQGQAPIFSSPGWDDSAAFGIMGDLIMEKLGLEDRNFVNHREALHRLFGPLDSLDAVAIFDELVRESNQIVLDERTWIYGCGDDAACRLGLLLNTLSPESSLTDRYLNHTRAIVSQSALQNQKYFSSFLTSSSFGTKEVVKRYGSIENVVHDPRALLDIVGLLYMLAPVDNPATPRVLSLRSKNLVRSLAGFSLVDKTILRREINTPDRIASILIRLHESRDSIFSQGAINKLHVMRTLLAEVNSPEAQRYDSWLRKTTPEKVLFQGVLPPVFQDVNLNLFSRHCSRCHGSGLAFPPQFLSGTEEEVLDKMKILKGKLLFKLENNLMPPNKSDRDALKNSGDYDRMLQFVSGL